MRCSNVRLVAGAVGLAMCAVAFAEADPRASFQRMTLDGLQPLKAKQYNSSNDRLVPAGETSIDLSVVGAPSRGLPTLRGASIIGMTDDLEAATVLPATANLQVTTPVWTETVPGTPDGDDSEWSAQIPPFAGFSSAAIGGNATKKARLRTNSAQPPDLFFFGISFDTYKDLANEVPLVVTPDPSQNARMDSEMFVTALSTLFSNEPIDGQTGFITSRVLWGGTCGGDGTDCTEFGLPNCFPGGPNTDPSCNANGIIEDFFTLGPNPNSFTTGIFVPCTFIGSAPVGFSVGDRVPVPVGSWIKMAHETTDDGDILHFIDYQDSQGEFTIYENGFLVGTRLGAWGANSSFEALGDEVYFDNFSMTGLEFVFPTPPALECDYLDTMEWLNPGQLNGQGNRWFDAVSSRANVVSNGNPDQAIRQVNNVVSNNAYREEFSTTLPETIATTSEWSLCADIRTTSFTATVRGFTPTANFLGSFVTRVFIGRDTGLAYDNGVYIQINPDYQPIDDEDCGPSGDCFIADSGDDMDEAGVPVIGTDVASTGFLWTHNNQFKELCVNVDNDASMTVEVNGSIIYTGTTLDGDVNGIDELRNESENNAGGPGDGYTIDNVELTCADAPEVVLPPLTFIYLDNADWGIENVTVGQHEELGGDPMEPFRWSSDPEVKIQADTLRGGDKLIAMPNVDRNQNLTDNDGNTDGLIDVDSKALTQLPTRIVNSSTGWVAGASIRVTDFTTTWFLRALQESIFDNIFNINTSIAIEAGTQQLWLQLPNGTDDSTWVPLGVTMADVGAAGIGANEWFNFRVARNPAGNFTYRFNNVLLRDSGGVVIEGQPLLSTDDGTHENLGGFSFGSGEEDTATMGSTMYVDDVRAHTLPCNGDVNGDGTVGFSDLNIILAQFGNDESIDGYQSGNINDANGDGIPDDGVVGFSDLNVALAGFGSTCD